MIKPRSPTLQEDSLPAEPQGTVVKHARVTQGYRCNLMTVIATIHCRGLTFSKHQPWLFCPPLTLGCLLPFYINRWGNGGSEISVLCPSLWLMLSLIPWVWIHDAEFKTWVLELQNPRSPSLGCTVSGSWKSEQGELELAREGLDMGTRRLCIRKYDGKRHLRPKDTFTKFYFFSLTFKKKMNARESWWDPCVMWISISWFWWVTLVIEQVTIWGSWIFLCMGFLCAILATSCDSIISK